MFELLFHNVWTVDGNPIHFPDDSFFVIHDFIACIRAVWWVVS